MRKSRSFKTGTGKATLRIVGFNQFAQPEIQVDLDSECKMSRRRGALITGLLELDLGTHAPRRAAEALLAVYR